MKLSNPLKWTLLTSLFILYGTGVWIWAMGSEPVPFRLLGLQIHSIVSLWFLALFGYLFHAHVIPAWNGQRSLKSGGTLTAMFIFLFLTVPALFYMTNESLKAKVVWAHTYVGLLLIVAFFVHLSVRKKGRKRK